MITEITEEPAPEVLKAIDDGLDAFISEQIAKRDLRPLAVLAKDDSGRLIAGLRGVTSQQWLFVNQLWVQSDFRKQGLGSELLMKAEIEARSRGCKHATLDTYSFQAPEFYERHGYVAFGILEECPPGHSRIYLRKVL